MINKNLKSEIGICLSHFLWYTVGGDRRTQFAPTLSRMVKQFKGSVTKQLGRAIWQKSYFDHIVRDDIDYEEKWNYIVKNPNKYFLLKEKQW